MNISSLGFTGSVNTHALKMVGSGQGKTIRQNNDGDKKEDKNSVAATLTISNPSSADRTKAITKRFESMRESLKKQMESLNERLRAASDQGNDELKKQLTESVKLLMEDLTTLDSQMNTALTEERQRQIDEAQEKEEEAAQKREKEQEKLKPDEERVKNEERESFEFFAASDITKGRIQNSKRQKAVLERSKGRLEGEMAIDAARRGDKLQFQRARESEMINGFSSVPYVSDKTILTENKRISVGSFTPDENDSLNELQKLKNGIANFDNNIGAAITGLNKDIEHRTEALADSARPKKEDEKDDKSGVGKVEPADVDIDDNSIEDARKEQVF